MKKTIFRILGVLICLAIIGSFAGCDDEGGAYTNNISRDTTVTANPIGGNDNGGNTSTSGSSKTRLTQDGVKYLVTDGKLIISGNGVVTREATESLSPEFNTVEFESGTFDIGDGAFKDYKNLTEVFFKNNVRNIGAEAFCGTNLYLVAFGESVEGIGDRAFADNNIDIVIINNEAMFKNFNSRYDFGEVAVTAPNVYVHESFIPFESGKDYTDYRSVAGKYLTDNDFLERLTDITRGRHSLSMESYQYRNLCGDCGFIPIIGGVMLDRILDDFSYDPDTNRIEYYFSDDPWQGRGIVRYDGTEDSDSVIGGSVIESHPVSEDADRAGAKDDDGGSGKSVPFVDNGGGTEDRGSDCFICGGSGKKDCTSCDGGYIIEYESGQYMGNGPTTREVRKDCPVCTGGQVTCYH